MMYTLVGFAADLDWRPLFFVKPIPQNKICHACGLVRRMTALLPCMHLLCESCYDACEEDGERVCPLDDGHWPDGDADWKETPVEEILKREVACWNKEHGCDAVMGASELSRHFQSECSHHTFSCPKCLASVHCRDVRVHLRSQCGAQATPFPSECGERSSCNDESGTVSSLKQALEEKMSEMRAYLILESNTRDGRLNEISDSVDVLKETLMQELTLLKEALTHELAEGRLREEMNTLKEFSRELVERIKKVQDYIAQCAREIGASNQDMKECLIANQTHSVNASNECLRELEEALREGRCSLAGGVRDILVSSDDVKACLLERMEAIENLCGTVKTSCDATNTELITATKRSTEQWRHVANAVKESAAEVKESCLSTSEWTMKALWLAEIHVNHCVFFVQEVAQHAQCAVDTGVAYYFDEPAYIAGYCISPGVTFMKAGRSATIHVAFILCKGYKDQPVVLPSHAKIKLSFIHPTNNSVREMVSKLSSFPYAQKPVRTSNGGLWFVDSSLGLEVLVRSGYLHGDRLHVKWELLL